MSSHLFGGNSLVHQPANLIFLDPWTLDPSNIRSIPMVSLLAVPFSDLWKAPCHRKWKFIVQTVYVQQFPIIGDHRCPNETKTLSPSLEVTEKLSQVTKNCQGTCCISWESMTISLSFAKISDRYIYIYMFFDLPKSPNYPYSVILPWKWTAKGKKSRSQHHEIRKNPSFKTRTKPPWLQNLNSPGGTLPETNMISHLENRMFVWNTVSFRASFCGFWPQRLPKVGPEGWFFRPCQGKQGQAHQTN